MVFGSNLFDEGLRQAGLRGSTASTKCVKHADNPIPIKALAEKKGPLMIYQFRLSLREQAYLRFCNVAYEVHNVLYPHLEAAGPGGKLPLLKDGQFMLPAVKICSYLSESYPELDLDAKLSGGRRADVEAFTALVDEKLTPLLRVSQYLEDKSYEQRTKPAIMRAVSFPMNMRVSSSERSIVHKESQARGLDRLPFPEIVVRARRIYKQLETRLENSIGDFFFGREPTSFDACLFGHLAEAMTDMHFLTIVPLYSNLLAYFQRLLEKFFSAEVDPRLVPDELTRQAWARANYVNSLNRFNQIDQLRDVTPVAPAAVVDKYYDPDTWKVKAKEPAKTKAETDEERKERRRNTIWLSVVGGIALLFLVVEGLASIMVTDADDEDAAGAEVEADEEEAD